MTSSVSVTILGKEYQVACPDEEQDALLASATLLHQNMEEIKVTGKVVGVERIAVIAALNLAHELITLKSNNGSDLHAINQQILHIKNKVSTFLDEGRQMEAALD